jgi:death-on-curing protein
MKQPVWMDERDARTLHGRLLALDGGVAGVRDEGLLQSAMARPQQLFAYGEANDIVSLAAAYTAGLIQNHPFIDGNKRVGFMTGIVFLEINGCRFTASEADVTRAILDLAAGKIDEAAFTEWLRHNVK